MERRAKLVDSLERKCNSVQSMINFLRDSPHKFNVEVCDNFLKTHGLQLDFSDIVSVYMLDCAEQIDTSDLSSFTSESHLPDHTNKSIIRSMGSHRMMYLRRHHNFEPVLTQDSMPAQIVQQTQGELIQFNEIRPPSRKLSCPNLQNKLRQVFNISRKLYKSSSTPIIRLKHMKKNLLCSRSSRKSSSSRSKLNSVTQKRSLDVFTLLFINEITQSALQRPHKAAHQQPTLQPLNKFHTSTIHFR